MERNIGFKERRYIEELRILTKATALDCVIDDRFDRVIYVIRPGDMGLAIGKKGENIKRLSGVLGKRIEMVEFAESPDAFITNIFKPAEVTSVEHQPDEGPVNVLVRQKGDLGIAIGKAGCNIEKARVLCRRFFGLEVGEVLLAREAGAV
jgi:N utilization substance protein A